MKKKILEFLEESNHIEGEYSDIAYKDSIKAWEYAFNDKDNITLSYILKIHEILMKRLRPDIAGKIRDCDVYIGGQRKFFISETLIRADLQMKVCFEMISHPVAGWEEHKAKQLHIDFENIHPFVDGNGRVGRILYNIHRLRLGLDLHVIHTGDEQKEYYKWFN